MQSREDAVAGALLGTALGDAIGLPYEALSRRRAARLFGAPDRHRFLFGRGMVSDDTEHSALVLQALARSGADVDAFRRDFARRLRWWLLGLPAGAGLATLRSILKLWVGVPPALSGVYSAGNGAAMRAAVLGAALDDVDALATLVRAATYVTHRDPRAHAGALAVALAAHTARRGVVSLDPLLARLRGLDGSDELVARLERVAASVARGESTPDFARAACADYGVTGFVLDTVPVALHAWLAHPHDAAAAIEAAVRCGGDTDTVAAIAGGVVGAGVGVAGLPQAWMDGLAEWPRSVAWMKALARVAADAVEAREAREPPTVNPVAVLARNVGFIAVVLAHVVRRALPPY